MKFRLLKGGSWKGFEKYWLGIATIEQDIEILKQGHIYENDRVPGFPKCFKVGARLDENLKSCFQK